MDKNQISQEEKLTTPSINPTTQAEAITQEHQQTNLQAELIIPEHKQKDISTILQTAKGNIIPDTIKTGQINEKPAIVFAMLNERNERVNVLMIDTLANNTQRYLQKRFTSIELRGYPTAKEINTKGFEPIKAETQTTTKEPKTPILPIDKKKPKGQEKDEVVQAPDILSAIFMATHCALHKQIKNLKGLIKDLTTNNAKLETKNIKLEKNEILKTTGTNIQNGEIYVKDGTLTVVPANQQAQKNQFLLQANNFQQDRQLQLPITTKNYNKGFTMN